MTETQDVFPDHEQQARELLARSQQERISRAAEDIKAVCEKHRVDLIPILEIAPGGPPRGEIRIVAKG